MPPRPEQPSVVAVVPNGAVAVLDFEPVTDTPVSDALRVDAANVEHSTASASNGAPVSNPSAPTKAWPSQDSGGNDRNSGALNEESKMKKSFRAVTRTDSVVRKVQSSWLDEKLTQAAANFVEPALTDSAEELMGKPRTLVGRIVHSQQFNVVTTLLILINGVLIGLETDHHADGSNAWVIIEVVFLIFYSIELALRISADGCRVYLYDGWIRFDTFVVSIAYVDLCILGPIMDGSPGAKQAAMVLRIMRLLKLTRVIRLLRFFKELWLLVSSFTSAFKTLSWTFILLVMVLYVFGILFVKMCGDQSEDEDIKEWFGSLPGAMFTLFQIMTLENWAEIARGVWASDQWYMMFMILFFIGVSSFAIMNTVMAVIVEHTLGEALKQQDDIIKKAQDELHNSAAKLLNIFLCADTDRSGKLSKIEFVEALGSAKVRQLLQEMDLGEDFSCLSPEEIGMLFDTIDIDNSKELSPHEFCDAMIQMRGVAKARRVFDISCDLRKLRNRTDRTIGVVQRTCDELKADAASQRAAFHTLEAKVHSEFTTISNQLHAISKAVGVKF